MSRAAARLHHASNLLVGGTGLVYAWMRYLLAPPDAFALVNHPLQPLVQRLHVIGAPLLVFAVGMVWSGHVWPRVRGGHRARRWSGLPLAATFLPMAASGVLLQTAVSEGWRQAWVVVHVATSLLWIAAYLAHQLRPRRARSG